MSTLHGSLLPFFKLGCPSWGMGAAGWRAQLETGFRRSRNTNGRVDPDDAITLFSMNTSANMLGGGFCVRQDGVNGQIGSRLTLLEISCRLNL